jgi:hypothetical protein
MGIPELQYEANLKARPVVVERDEGVTRIVVLMQGPYAPVPRWVGDLDLLALVVAPVWWMGTLLVRTCLRIPKPPRAVFEVSDEQVKMSLRDPGSGEISAFEWARSAVAEARANRYERGLWINVPGHVKDTYLTDLPRESTEQIEAALSSALAGVSASRAAAANAANHPCSESEAGV